MDERSSLDSTIKNKLEGLFPPIDWYSRYKTEKNNNAFTRINDQFYMSKYNLNVMTPVQRSLILKTLIDGYNYEIDACSTAIENSNTLLTRLEDMMRRNLDIQREMINYFLVVLTLILSTYIPMLEHGWRDQLSGFWARVYITSILASIFPTMYLMMESIYCLSYLTNIEQNVVYTMHKNESIIHQMELKNVEKVLIKLKKYLPLIITFGNLSIIYYCLHNDTWDLLFVACTITIAVCLYNVSVRKDNNSLSIWSILIGMITNCDVEINATQTDELIKRYEQTKNDMKTEHATMGFISNDVLYFDRYEYEIKDKFKLLRKIDHAMNNLIGKGKIEKVKNTVGYYWSNKKNWKLLRNLWSNFNDLTIDGLVNMGLENLIELKNTTNQTILDLQHDLFLIKTSRKKTRILLKNAGRIIQSYELVNKHEHKHANTNECFISLMMSIYSWFKRVIDVVFVSLKETILIILFIPLCIIWVIIRVLIYPCKRGDFFQGMGIQYLNKMLSLILDVEPPSFLSPYNIDINHIVVGFSSKKHIKF